MKKITVIFGGSVGLYSGYFRIFDEIEKQLSCSVRRDSPYSFSTKIKDTRIEFKFCICPTRDKAYYSSKKYLETTWKEVVPVPADELVKKIKSDKVLFLGICGSFKGKMGEISFPEEFHEILFEDVYIKHKEILKIKPMNKVAIKNILKEESDGKKKAVVTSNITLTPDAGENKD